MIEFKLNWVVKQEFKIR